MEDEREPIRGRAGHHGGKVGAAEAGPHVQATVHGRPARLRVQATVHRLRARVAERILVEILLLLVRPPKLLLLIKLRLLVRHGFVEPAPKGFAEA